LISTLRNRLEVDPHTRNVIKTTAETFHQLCRQFPEVFEEDEQVSKRDSVMFLSDDSILEFTEGVTNELQTSQIIER
jgi:hypothetical protein